MARFRNAFLSLHVLFCFHFISLGSSQNDPAQAMPYTTQCKVVSDCGPNSEFKKDEAFACVDGVCICHPNATYDADLNGCKCNEGFVKSGSIPGLCTPVSPSPLPALEPRAGPAVPPPPAAAASCTSTSCKENEECTSRGCECRTDYVNVAGRCLLVARRVGDPCEDKEQCKRKLGGYSSCREGRCTCTNASVPVQNDEVCILKKGLLEVCEHEAQCTHITNARCATDICLCRDTHVPNEASTACIPAINIFEGDCTISLQCQKGSLGPGSECVKTSLDGGKCVCVKSYFFSNDVKKCLQIRGHGEQCDNTNTGCYLPADEDNQGIECKKGTCQCKKKYTLSADKLNCNSGLKIHSSIFFTVVSFVLTRRW